MLCALDVVRRCRAIQAELSGDDPRAGGLKDRDLLTLYPPRRVGDASFIKELAHTPLHDLELMAFDAEAFMRRTKHEHRPHRKKREHERYHCAQLVRDYRKQQRRAEAERGGERPHKRALVDDEAAAATHPRVDEPQRKVQRPRGQPRPSAFSKELRAAAQTKSKAAEERAAAAARQAAIAGRADQRRKDRARLAKRTRRGQPIMKHQITSMLEKIQATVASEQTP